MMAEDGRVDVCVAVRRGAKKLMCEFVTAPITWTLDELWQHTVETKLPDLVAEPDRTGLFVDNVVLFNTSCVPWVCLCTIARPIAVPGPDRLTVVGADKKKHHHQPPLTPGRWRVSRTGRVERAWACRWGSPSPPRAWSWA